MTATADPPSPPASRAASVLAALFTPAVLCVSAANNIILRNLLDLPYDAGTVLLFLAAFVGAAAAVLPAFLLADRVRVCGGLARGVLYVGAAVLLSSPLSAMHAGHDRAGAFIAAVDLLLLGALAMVVWRVPMATLRRVCSVMAAVLLVAGVAQHALTLFGERQRAQTRAAQAAELKRVAASDTTTAGNVYHLVLDAFQTEAFMVLAEREPAFRFPGFTFYPEFTAHYARTNHSLPNALAGRHYRDGESIHGWREEAFTAGLWGALAERNVGLHLYPHYPPYCTPLATTCQATLTFAESFQPSTPFAGPRRVTIDLWFLSLLPPSLRSLVNAPFTIDPHLPRGGDEHYGFSITSLVRPLRPIARATTDRLPDFPHAAAYSVMHFDQMLADEANRPARGQYVFFHAILPHWPFVVDDTCAYIGESDAAPHDAFLAQSVCALRLLDRLVARLRELDRLDDALIVVHADHGGKGGAGMLRAAPDAWPGPAYGTNLTWPDGDRIPSRAWPHHLIDLYRRALLLVKPPGATEYTTDAAPVQTIDLAPTIARHFGVDETRFPGMAIPDLADAPAREVPFFTSGAIPTAHVPRAFSRFVFRDGVWTHDAELSTAR